MFRKGNLVEVLRREKHACGSWFAGKIISVDGDNYVVRYQLHKDCYGDPVMEKVCAANVRPKPPYEKVKRWHEGEMAEVLDISRWRVGKIVKVLKNGYFVIKFFGSIQLNKFHISNLRIRQAWQNNKWLIIGKTAKKFTQTRSLVQSVPLQAVCEESRSRGCEHELLEEYGIHCSNTCLPVKTLKRSHANRFERSSKDPFIRGNCKRRKSSLKAGGCDRHMGTHPMFGQADNSSIPRVPLQAVCGETRTREHEHELLPVKAVKRSHAYCSKRSSKDPFMGGNCQKRKSSLNAGGCDKPLTGTHRMFKQADNSSIPRLTVNEKFTDRSTEMDAKIGKATNNWLHTSIPAQSPEDNNLSSFASCSAMEFVDHRVQIFLRTFENASDSSDAESSSTPFSGRKHLSLPPEYNPEVDIHELELLAYKSIVYVLYDSGPLSWERESLLADLRSALNISDDEHGLQLKHLLSTQIP